MGIEIGPSSLDSCFKNSLDWKASKLLLKKIVRAVFFMVMLGMGFLGTYMLVWSATVIIMAALEA